MYILHCEIREVENLLGKRSWNSARLNAIGEQV